MVKARGSTPLYNMCMMSFLLCVFLVSSVNKKRSTYFSTPFRDSVGIRTQDPQLRRPSEKMSAIA